MGWERYQQLVLAELRRLSGEVGLLRGDLSGTRLEVARLQVKAGLWGAAAGVLAAIAAVLMGGL